MRLISAVLKKYLAQYSGLSMPCWSGILFGFMQTSIGSVFYFLSIYFVNNLNYTISESGFLISCYGFGAVAGGYFGGKLSDHVHPRLAALVSLVVQAAAILGLLIVTDRTCLTAILFLLGAAVYSFITANYTYTLAQCGENESSRLKVINILSMSSNLGLGVSALIIGGLSGIGFTQVFLTSGLLLLLLSLHGFMSHAGSFFQFTSNHEDLSESVERRPIFTYKTLIILLCVMLAGLMISQMSTTYPIYIENKFPLYGVHGVSVAFAVNSLLVVFFQAPLVNFFGRFNASMVMATGGFLLGFGMICFSFSSKYYFILIACVVYTMGEMLFFSMAQLHCYQFAPRSKRGRGLGLFRMTYAASRMLGPVMGGYIFQQLGGDVVWYVCGILGIFCFALCGMVI